MVYSECYNMGLVRGLSSIDISRQITLAHSRENNKNKTVKINAYLKQRDKRHGKIFQGAPGMSGCEAWKRVVTRGNPGMGNRRVPAVLWLSLAHSLFMPPLSFPSSCLPQLLLSYQQPPWSCLLFQPDEGLVPSELNRLPEKEFTHAVEADTSSLLGNICISPGSPLRPYQKRGKEPFVSQVSQTVHIACIFEWRKTMGKFQNSRNHCR